METDGRKNSKHYHEKIKLCKELDPDDKETKEQILIGLCDWNLCYNMSDRCHENLNALKHEMGEYTPIEEARRERYGFNKVTNNQKSQRAATEEEDGAKNCNERNRRKVTKPKYLEDYDVG
ncbi:hypothetical protein Trydic_g12509 [Trypoxylus dichotomus]